ncbi:endonuclease/exonuclease/phosphatase family protein [Carboxylicivirga caseinilyticus]|uniref:endonuclease/exonuclease/phosphatase family protein n=1 Tax=Carboxylicivirga caseinilyticus TaxID=3417572 RepID=UPI003D3320A4|nr:endonuclease [Marinilabiliaceae bacterium A049]
MIRLLFILLLFSIHLTGQTISPEQYSIMFYNVENLFDCEDDSLTLDDEFTFEGDYHWSYNRYKQKLNQISKVILNVNQWNYPSIIGLCEIENAKVLNQLIYETGLNNLNFKFIHYNSPDRRGIDVALLYSQSKFTVLSSHPINLTDPTSNFYTRDALYVKGVALSRDTLHLIVNHWPSKRGGETASAGKRIRVAGIIKSVTDSIQLLEKDANIILMGDFNDELDSEAIQLLLKEGGFHSLVDQNKILLHNIGGSHKFQGQWSLIDHILISSHLKQNDSVVLSHKIGYMDWQLEEDKSYSGLKPKRTYSGPRYIGGVSDHLPVILTIQYKKR